MPGEFAFGPSRCHAFMFLCKGDIAALTRHWPCVPGLPTGNTPRSVSPGTDPHDGRVASHSPDPFDFKTQPIAAHTITPIRNLFPRRNAVCSTPPTHQSITIAANGQSILIAGCYSH
jgi:hypothetical protein